MLLPLLISGLFLCGTCDACRTSADCTGLFESCSLDWDTFPSSKKCQTNVAYIVFLLIGIFFAAVVVGIVSCATNCCARCRRSFSSCLDSCCEETRSYRRTQVETAAPTHLPVFMPMQSQVSVESQPPPYDQLDVSTLVYSESQGIPITH